MGIPEITIGCVGKPSAGKSSFLNSATDASAKVGNFPFTTIKPNVGVSYFKIDCPCKRFNKAQFCNPKRGKCEDGNRFVPVKVLDVAGLVPGASEGKGLGNQFLDDLTGADCFIHVVDVSGTTDANGKVTIGYDPSNDVEWLKFEIHNWIYNNLKRKWPEIVRRHVAKKSTISQTFQLQLSGYGTKIQLINKLVENFDNRLPLESWDDDTLRAFVDVFIKFRFPTVIALNKIDLPDADKNIDKLAKKYDPNQIVLVSALAESFLRKLQKQKFILYEEGTEFFKTFEDLEEDRINDPTIINNLKLMDEKTRARLEKVQDLVLFRFGHTGVQDTIKKAIELLGLIPVFPVRNINNFTDDSGSRTSIFGDCFLIKPGTTVLEFAKMLNPEIEKTYQYAETVGGIRMGEDELLTFKNNIVSFKTSIFSKENT
ncbi:hypothetical protein HDU92_006594 [Lobulomyces angularis]|nr:hypothetical protein HDU92_006594 [Lobulomyces angularis]